MKIFVRIITERTITLDVNPADSIEDVKAEIERKENIPPYMQILLFLGRPMKNDRSLSYYNVQEESILHLALRLRTDFQIFVEVFPGKTINLVVDPLDTTENVKVEVQNKEGIPVCQQKMIFAERQLEDELTLADFKVIYGVFLISSD
ncbi:ubiquitin-like [Saccostrea cucullata]|uniref:ubiquitin-like n=1 Tax=Saccostrea cuccullata TaxID=36930 RepID=UPI002ED1C711